MGKMVNELKEEFTKTTDFIMEEVKSLKSTIAQKDTVIKSLQSEQTVLKDELHKIRNRVSVMEKLSRDRNVELQAVPENRNENVVSMVKSLCETIELPISDSDIHACRRVAKMDTTSKRPRNIVVTLTSPRLRDSLISAVHRYNKEHSDKKLNTNHIGIKDVCHQIYVSEHLSPECKQLYAAARRTRTSYTDNCREYRMLTLEQRRKMLDMGLLHDVVRGRLDCPELVAQLALRAPARRTRHTTLLLMQHPTTDLETLRRRQDVIAFFLRPQSDVIMKNMCSSLRFIKNVNGILAKIKALSAKAYQWKSLYNTLYNAVLICEMCEGAARSSEFLQELASCDNNKLYEMALYMNRIIDFDLTKSEGKFTVKAGVDPDLDMKKQTMASLHGLMSETAKVELERLPGFVQECTMLYMPHLGYLLGVKAWADDLTMEQKELPNMRFMFQNNDYIHYKSKGCEELDMMIGDTYPEIVAHETRIMMRLTTIILENLHTLAAVIDKCSELDCLIAISKVCKEFGFVRPTLTTEKVLSITQGRHPLHAAASDCFVPNDTESSREAGLVKILTGPNSSGKSVYMKQIGLIVYLAHIGSFVPAERATIGVVAHIYSRIQSTECVAAHMSAFLIDLRQMALALQESTSNSLIIIDEFGKGTSEVDGLALLAACLNTFLFREDNCPHLLLSTHFLDIQKYIVNTPIVRFQRFEHTLQDGEPVFLFRLIEGSASCSFAHDVAQASGIDAGVVKRARQLMDCITNNKLPPENKKITAKLKSFTEIIKNDLLAEDI
ncbi:mutS protein homolog 5-like [Ostrinia nubilalis]|uniref:mutS protein homolog 5-like n=1 Tax=Ostrinia nubilalis TaxID=29057 RepID=UPI00308225EB